jgi:hypothetical protein
MAFNATFNNILAVSFIGGGNPFVSNLYISQHSLPENAVKA